MKISLADGFKLQWSTEKDIDRIASSMEPVYQSPDDPSEFIRFLITDQYKRWAFGESKLMTPNDTVFVTDTNTEGHPIVAFTTLWKDTQLYKGIPFSIGRVEFVGVLEQYRNRGIMRSIMDAVHEASDKRGDMMQTIVGIPYYYRQFDYEYALDIGMRSKTWLNSIPPLKEDEIELVTLRAATQDDNDMILEIDAGLRSVSCNYAPLRPEYLEAQITDSMDPAIKPFKRRVVIFEHADKPIGFAVMHAYADPSGISVLSIGFKEGVNLPTMIYSVIRGIVQYMHTCNGEEAFKKLSSIMWHFSEWHPFFDSLPSVNRSYTGLPDEAYSTYVRIPNYANFVRHIIPVLNQRLATSKEWSNYNGALHIHQYTKKHTGLEIQIKNGEVATVQDWYPFEGQPLANMIRFPPLTFTNVLLGNKSLSELERMYPDIMASDLTKKLVNVLFPKSLSINWNWSSGNTCDIDEELVQKLKDFRFKKFSKGNAAFVLKIDKKTLKVVEDEEYDDIGLEDLVEELPENSPRFVILSYELKHKDGRQSFPLVFVYWSPKDVNPQLHMLYATAKTYLQEKIDVTRGFDIRDSDDLTDDFLQSQLMP